MVNSTKGWSIIKQMDTFNLLLIFIGGFVLVLLALPFIILMTGSKSIWTMPGSSLVSEFKKWQFWENEASSKFYIFYFHQELGPFSLGFGRRKVFFTPNYLFKTLKPGEMEVLLRVMAQNTSFSKSLFKLVSLFSFFITYCVLSCLAQFNFFSSWSLSSHYFDWKIAKKASIFNLKNLPNDIGMEMENLASRCRRSLEEYNSLR